MKRYMVFQSKICVAFYIYDDENRYQRIQGYEVWALKNNMRTGKKLTRKIIEEKLRTLPTFGKGQTIKSTSSMLRDCVSGTDMFRVTIYKL